MQMRYGPVLSVVALVCVAAAGWYWLKDGAPDGAPAARGQGRRAAQRDGPVPVTVDTVKKETVPVYREGIGNVQALYAVTVRAQVDGRLISVDFAEGQELHKGDVLARIDPTTYKAQYDQAVAKKAQDQAMLANARLDLVRYQKLAQTNAGPQQQADQQQSTDPSATDPGWYLIDDFFYRFLRFYRRKFGDVQLNKRIQFRFQDNRVAISSFLLCQRINDPQLISLRLLLRVKTGQQGKKE